MHNLVLAARVSMDPNKVDTMETSLFQILTWCIEFPEAMLLLQMFLKGFTVIVKPLHEPTENKWTLQWSRDCNQAIGALTIALYSELILAFPPAKESTL